VARNAQGSLLIEGFCVAAGVPTTEKAVEIIDGLKAAGIPCSIYEHYAFQASQGVQFLHLIFFTDNLFVSLNSRQHICNQVDLEPSAISLNYISSTIIESDMAQNDAIKLSAWKSSLKTGKKPRPDQTITDQDQK
jgi:hypothetical protein